LTIAKRVRKCLEGKKMTLAVVIALTKKLGKLKNAEVQKNI
jgi:hypothetical protein